MIHRLHYLPKNDHPFVRGVGCIGLAVVGRKIRSRDKASKSNPAYKTGGIQGLGGISELEIKLIAMPQGPGPRLTFRARNEMLWAVREQVLSLVSDSGQQDRLII